MRYIYVSYSYNVLSLKYSIIDSQFVIPEGINLRKYVLEIILNGFLKKSKHVIRNIPRKSSFHDKKSFFYILVCVIFSRKLGY